MRDTIKRNIREFKAFWKHYIFQSAFAAFSLFIALILLNIEKRPIMIASIGATAFIVFAMPNNIAAQPRNIIGGYLVGIIVGSLCALTLPDTYLSSIVMYSLAVGISIFIMVVIDTEHPPASGVALSFAINGFSPKAAVTITASVIILSLIHHSFKKYLRDLT